MNNPKISIIAAIGPNRELGKDNKLLWHISEDLKRFKALTTGNVIIMGRKTYESIGKPLPNRTNIVITRNKSVAEQFIAPEINGAMNRTATLFYNSMEDAIKKGNESNKEIFIIGGGQIYQEALKYADKLYLTLVQGKFEADTFFPDYSIFKKVVAKEEGEEKGQRFTFVELIK